MSANGKPTIDRIDHGVIPSNDLGRAHRFYGTFMGGEIDHLTNLTIRGLNREVPQIVFYTLANHKGWGVALQDFPISPNPARRVPDTTSPLTARHSAAGTFHFWAAAWTSSVRAMAPTWR